MVEKFELHEEIVMENKKGRDKSNPLKVFVGALVVFSMFLLSGLTLAQDGGDVKVILPSKKAQKAESSKQELEAIPVEIKTEPLEPRPARITMSVYDTSLGVVLNMLFKGSRSSYVIEKGVNLEETVFSLNAKDEELGTVLTNLLTPLGYSYKLEGNRYRIIAFETATFDLPMSPFIKVNESVISNASTQGASTITSGSAVSTDLSKSVLAMKEDSKGLWTDVEADIKRLVVEGWYSINRAGSTITVYERVPKIALLREYFDSIKKQLSRQVLIEVKVVETKLYDATAYGVDWSQVVRVAGLAEPALATISTAGSVFDAAGGSGASAAMVAYSGIDVSGVLKALGEIGKISMISQPRLFVVNNQSAIIQLTQGENYISKITSTVSTTSTSTSVDVGVVQTGVSLLLIPKISPDNKQVTLFLTPMITELEGMKQVTVDSVAVELPKTSYRGFGSTVTIKDGETIIIGGLQGSKTTGSKKGVPYLSRIPIIGAIFGYHEDTDAVTDLSVILTAKVVPSDV